MAVNNSGDVDDQNFLGIWSGLKFGPDVNADFFGLWLRNINSNDLSMLTFGVNGNLQLNDFTIETELAVQTGQMDKAQDIAANLFALNGSYTFSQLPVKPGIAAGIDRLSGDDNRFDNDNTVFNTLFATNHKYYGMMDYFINIPLHTYGLGLNDLHFGLSSVPCECLKLSLTFHHFRSTEEVTWIDGTTMNVFGNELDFLVDYKYNAHVNFQGGAAVFLPGDIFKQINGNDNSLFFYLSTSVKL